MRGSSWRDRFRYWFDGWMSRGTGAILALLALATIVFVLLLGGITWLIVKYAGPDIGAPDPGDAPWDYYWDILIGTLFPGGTGSDVGWGFRVLMLVIAVGGLLFGATLIGLITGGFQRRIDELRKGRSRVLESGHTVILGWSPKVFTIISELAIANASRRRSTIAVLAAKDKPEMEDEIRERVGRRLGGTRVICRSGDIRRRADLEMVAADRARSVILVGESGPDRDNEVIKSAFALTHPTPDPSIHITGVLSSERKLGVARIAGGPDVQWLLGPELIGRILVQACRQSGLAQVYRMLLDFEGDEIYFTDQPDLVGATYSDAQLAFPDCTVIGLVRDGEPRLNPPHDMRIRAHDEVIVIAEDDSTIRLGPIEPADLTAVRDPTPSAMRAERTLLLGGGERLDVMLSEMDELVVPGSHVHIISVGKKLPLLRPLSRIEVTKQRSDPTDEAVIDALDLEDYDHVIVMPEVDSFEPSRAESRTLVTLLLLYRAMSRTTRRLDIVAEMLDDANRELAVRAGVEDFIVSDRLVALMLAQVSENPGLYRVFAELLDAEGSEIYLHPAQDYVDAGVEVGFGAVLEAARRRGETAIGYRIGPPADDSDANGGVRLNPPKRERRAFAPGDSIIVIGSEL